jgi:hypothetical protein
VAWDAAAAAPDRLLPLGDDDESFFANNDELSDSPFDLVEDEVEEEEEAAVEGGAELLENGAPNIELIAELDPMNGKEPRDSSEKEELVWAAAEDKITGPAGPDGPDGPDGGLGLGLDFCNDFTAFVVDEDGGLEEELVLENIPRGSSKSMAIRFVSTEEEEELELLSATSPDVLTAAASSIRGSLADC